MSCSQRCPICESLERKQLYLTRDRHFKIPGEWSVAKCLGCGLVQISPMLDSDALMELYPKNFYAFQDLAKKNQGFRELIKRLLFPTLLVKDPKFNQPGKVLDSGCGTGWALMKFKEQGWECVGVEPSKAAAQFGVEHYGLDIKAGTVNTVELPNRSFDYIRSNHSLEHDPVPGETLDVFRRLIKPDGVLLIGVPNIGGLFARLFGRYWWYLGAPVHAYNFTLPHLKKLLLSHGFEVVRVRYTGNYGGVIGSLQIFLNRNDQTLASTDGRLINSSIAKVIGQGISAIANLFHQGDAIEIIARPVEK
jgi:SAM-dependent methyltransferase